MTTALVTGATSGIGAEFARQLAARGENLVLVARKRERLADQARPIDTLVSNAGFGYPNGLDADTAVHEQAIDVMATAVLVLGNTAAAAMTRRGHGRIITVASLSAWIAQGSYSAVKAFAKVYSEGLSVELHGTGVTATALCPGWVRTEFHERGDIDASGIPAWVWVDAERCVRESLAHADVGRAISLPTKRWKAAAFALQHLPRSTVRAITRAVGRVRQ